MNWYKNVKTAGSVIKPTKSQVGWEEYFGDEQRYGMDAYEVRVYCTKTNKKIVVSLTVSMQQMGTIMWQWFWKYDLNEMEKAKKTFEKVKTKVSGIVEDFRVSEDPNCMLWTYLRDVILDIDPEYHAKTNIPHINFSQKVKNEKDVRTQIYGNRYPGIEGF